jgi:hypothetical protein
MLENVSELLNISPFIVIGIVIILQLLSQGKDIKNKNIIENRLVWLSELKEDFSKYNTSLSNIIDFTSIVEDSRDLESNIQTMRQELEQNRINILLKFKSHSLEEQPIMTILTKDSFNENILKKLNTIKTSDECEKYMIHFMNIINSYYITKINSNNIDFNEKNVEDIIISDKIFLEYIQQFQTCLCKIEWNRINNESKLLNLRKNNKKDIAAVETLKKNLTFILESYNEDDLLEDNEVEKTKEDSAQQFVNENWSDNESVPTNLIQILNKIDATTKIDKKSLKTSSGKRFIYSAYEPVHPSAKPFVNPKYIELKNSKINIYLETNFSVYQGKRVAERIFRELSTIV